MDTATVRLSIISGETPAPGDVPAQNWPLVKKILFRFIFVYLLLYNLPFPLNLLPFFSPVEEKYVLFWNSSVAWIGEHVLHLSNKITVFENGSGDTTFNYVQVLCFAVLTVAGVAVWSVLDRKRPDYSRLHQWFRTYVRFVLASWMLEYGAMKVIKTQFPDPTPGQLLEPIGNASPMGLLWTFMGASEPYTVFTGAMEMLGGLLLLFPRAVVAGALVSAGVLSNVVMLNFSYDVPVKLFSMHLLAMSIVLLAPDMKRLANVLLLNRTAEPAGFTPLFQHSGMNRAAMVFGTVLSAALIWLPISEALQTKEEIAEYKKSPFYGTWSVDSYEVDGKIVPPLLTEKLRWKYLFFSKDTMGILFMSDVQSYVKAGIDLQKKTVTLSRRGDPKWHAQLSFQQTQPQVLTLGGNINGQLRRATLNRVDESKFLLNSRGFHWINEYPFNR